MFVHLFGKGKLFCKFNITQTFYLLLIYDINWFSYMLISRGVLKSDLFIFFSALFCPCSCVCYFHSWNFNTWFSECFYLENSDLKTTKPQRAVTSRQFHWRKKNVFVYAMFVFIYAWYDWFSRHYYRLALWWLTHWGRDKMAAFSQTTLSNAFTWMKTLGFQLKIHWSLFLRVLLTIFQHWFW